MNIKRILLSPATILVIATMVIGFFMTICGQVEIGIPMMIYVPCMALLICSLSVLTYGSNWKLIIIIFFGTVAAIFVAYITLLKPEVAKNRAVFWALEF
jgi:hypothetical protein